MQYKNIAILGLAASAAAAKLEKKQDAIPTDAAAASAFAVLATAVPQSLIQLGLTNQPAVASIIESEFAAGNTPEWYSALPTDVQAYLTVLGQSAIAETAAPSSGSGSPSGSGSGAPTGGSSAPTTASTPTGAPTGGSPTSATNTPGAAMPTAVIGSGLAGVVALVGMLAL